MNRLPYNIAIIRLCVAEVRLQIVGGFGIGAFMTLQHNVCLRVFCGPLVLTVGRA